MAVSPYRKYEDELLVRGVTSGFVSIIGGITVGMLVNPFLGIAIFLGSGRVFLKTINTPNPHSSQ